jgi:CheY-like chemotaxis protein
LRNSIIAHHRSGVTQPAAFPLDDEAPQRIAGIRNQRSPHQGRRFASLRSIPIIAVTSYALSGEGQKARATGCDDYVPKPYSPRELLAKIRQYLQ